MKKLIQTVLGRFGYRLEKIRGSMPGPHLNLFQAFLSMLNQKRNGAVQFVEIGAHDGRQDDPLYPWITRFHWAGVLVEPQPRLFERLKQNYGGVDHGALNFKQAVVSPVPGIATLYTLADAVGDPNPEWSSQLASLKKEVILSHRHAIFEFDRRLQSCQVQAVTYRQLAEESGILKPDVLQIDTEGFDFEILKMVDFDRHKPALINYEHCNLSGDDQHACRHFLAQHDYGFASYVRDTIACQPELLAERGFGYSAT